MSIAQSARELAHRIRRFQRPGIVLGLMIAGFGLAHIHWIVQDTRPMHHWDPYAYLGNLFGFLDAIAQGDTAVGKLLSDLSHLGRPPLYQLLTVPLVLLFGRSVDAALMINIFFLALLLICTYHAARLVTNERAGYLAAFLVSTYPTMAHLAHVYRPHYAVPACVALSLALLFRLVREPSAAAVWQLAFSVVFGLWIHPLYGFFGGLTIALAAVAAALSHSLGDFSGLRGAATRMWGFLRHPLTLRAVLPALLLVFALVAPWYGVFSRDPFAHFVGNVVTTKPDEPGVSWLLRNAPSAMSTVLFVAAILAMLGFAYKRRLMTTTLLFATVGAYLGPAALIEYPDWWHSASMLPPLAVLIACWVMEIGRPLAAVVALVAVVLVASFNFSVAMWDVDRPLGLVSKALGAPPRDSRTCAIKSKMILCPDPPQKVYWPYREILAAFIEEDTCRRPQGCRAMVIGGDRFNSYIFGYTARLHWSRARVAMESQGLSHRPFPLRCFLESDYVLYVDFPGKLGPHSSVSYSVATRVLLQSPPAALAESHQTVATFELPNGRQATVAERVGAVDEEEVEAVAQALREWNISYDRETRQPIGGRCSQGAPVG